MAGKFAMDISRFVKKAKDNMDEAVRTSMYGLCENVVKATPVKTGQARGNWLVTLNRGPLRIRTGVLDKAGDKTLSNIAKVLEGYQTGKTKTIWFTNTLPYIIRLEYGWSQQAPSGMVRLAMASFKAFPVKGIGV